MFASADKILATKLQVRLAFKALLRLSLAAALAFPAVASVAALQAVSWTPQKIVNGSPCLFRVQMATVPLSLTGRWQGRDLAFVASADRNVWYALAGVDVETKPGHYALEVQATLPNGARVRQRKMVAVGRAKFAKEKLRVPERYVEPDAGSRVRIEADHELKRVAFAHEMPTAAWSGNFRPPVDSAISEHFGTRRSFNGKLASIHRGLDYRALPGTPVMAANSGVVVLAHELFYEGNCVIIDHGQQFATIYMHLSQLQVSEGQKVEKGQEIGLSGASGRTTGPHLHVAARWQGAYLDPAQLWSLRLPDLHAASLSRASAQTANP